MTVAYREPWFWVVFAPLILIVPVCAVLLRFALVGGDDIVRDDYYKQGRMINNTFAAEHRAVELGIGGHARFDSATGEMNIVLRGEDLPVSIRVTLSHPAEALRDQVAQLARASANHYRGRLATVPEGRFYLLVEGVSGKGAWRIGSEMDFNQQALTSFGHASTSPLETLR